MPWNYVGLSLNLNTTMEFVEKNMDKPWNWIHLFLNPNMTAEFALEHRDLSDWADLAINECASHKVLRTRAYTRRILRKWKAIAVKRIAMRKELYDPVIDMLRMRIRDVSEQGVSKSLVVVPARLL